ncbi:MAG: hypothetical protein ABSD44_03010 [Terracidiphilus sp.]
MNRKNLIAGFLMLLTLSAIGCGGSSGSGGGTSSALPMTPTQASAAYGDVFTAMEDATLALPLARSAPVSPIRKEEAAAIQKAILNGARTPVSADSVSPDLRVSPDTTTTFPAYTYKCPAGGTIVVTGSYSMTSSSDSASIVETINSCSDSGVTFNGDPNITFSWAASDNGTTTSLTITMTGGLTVGSSSCSTDLNTTGTISDKTGSGTETYSGSFCGRAISGSITI